MRWFSRFALVCYLCLLCTPQAFVVQDLRLSPLAENQLQALLSNVASANYDQSTQTDNQPPTGLPANDLIVLIPACYGSSIALVPCYQFIPFQLQQARAPPLTT